MLVTVLRFPKSWTSEARYQQSVRRPKTCPTSHMCHINVDMPLHQVPTSASLQCACQFGTGGSYQAIMLILYYCASRSIPEQLACCNGGSTLTLHQMEKARACVAAEFSCDFCVLCSSKPYQMNLVLHGHISKNQGRDLKRGFRIKVSHGKPNPSSQEYQGPKIPRPRLS